MIFELGKNSLKFEKVEKFRLLEGLKIQNFDYWSEKSSY